MTEPIDPIVQRAMLSNDVAYEVLLCDPYMAETAAFCAPDELTKVPNVVVVEGLAKPK